MNKLYEKCMEIGYLFNKYYGQDERTVDWNASEECSTVTRMTYDLSQATKATLAASLDIVMDMIFKFGFNNIEDHMWDDYCKGFIAGEKLGMPTPRNISKCLLADSLWDENQDYGYYQEVIDAVKDMEIKPPIRVEEQTEFVGQIIDVIENFLTEKGVSFPETKQLMIDSGMSEEEAEGNDVVLYGENYDALAEPIEKILISWGIFEEC